MGAPCIFDCSTLPPAPVPPELPGIQLPDWFIPAIAVLGIILGIGILGYALSAMDSLRRWLRRRLER